MTERSKWRLDPREGLCLDRLAQRRGVSVTQLFIAKLVRLGRANALQWDVWFRAITLPLEDVPPPELHDRHCV